MKNITTKKIFKYALMIFLMIQPIFDFKVFYNSVSTLIRVVIVFLFFIYYFFSSKNKKKYFFVAYAFILGVYFIFHSINANNFNSLVPGNFNYSIIKEILYFVKMLTPFMLIYAVFEAKLSKSDILKLIKGLTLVISLIIIITNIFVVSYGSYSDQIIKANFFSWFSSNEFTYQELASKGIFEYANQISAILIMFLPFNLISLLDNKKIKDILILCVNALALFLLGTKVSVLGVFLVFGYTVFVYVFYKKIINKEKIPKKPVFIILSISVFYSIILPNNPMFMRMDETKTIEAVANVVETVNTQTDLNENTNVDTNINVDLEDNTEKIEDEHNDLIKYIEQNYNDKQIKEEFITTSYPYQYDPEFWIKIFDEPLSNRVDYRFIETMMIKRVIEINNNKCDVLLGISNTRIQNIFNIERDFVVQYYALGIIGLILVILPYFIIMSIYVCKILKSRLKKCNVIEIISLITIVLIFGIAYVTGNLLNSLSFTLYFVLLFNLLLNTEFYKDKSTD